MDKMISYYLSHKKRLIPLHDKMPIANNWVNSRFMNLGELKAIKNANGYGWALDDTDLIIDVDIKNGNKGAESYAKLLCLCPLHKTVTTKSGGWHVYLKKPADLKIPRHNPNYPGIDFLSRGAQVVIAGSPGYKFDDESFNMFTQEQMPEALVNELAISSIDALDEAGMTNADLLGGEDINAINSILEALDPSCDYHQWITIGMAIHNEMNGTLEGLDLWDNWSKSGSTYKEGECAKKWRTFHKSNISVSIGTLKYYYTQAQQAKSRLTITNEIDIINKSNNPEEIYELLRKAAKWDMDLVYIAELENAAQVKLKVLLGKAPPIATLREMTKSTTKKAITAPANSWVDEWVYVTAVNKYYNIKTYENLNTSALNATLGYKVPASTSGSRMRPVDYLSQCQVKTVNAIAYLPFKEMFINFDGKSVLNTFNPLSIPLESEANTIDAEMAIERVKKHIDLICRNDEATDWFMQWIAFNVQKMGSLVGYVPIIIGEQGIGKSYIAKLLRAITGYDNVVEISPAQAMNDFNSWATNHCIGVFEELLINGMNRTAVMNRLKPLITNDRVMITYKGKDSINIPNVTNYIAFTNHNNALKLERFDRRWWVIEPGYSNIDDYCEAGKIKSASNWFNQLFSDLDTYGKELRHFFLNYPISKEFLINKNAPLTQSKKNMVEREKEDIKGYDIAREIIASNRNQYINRFYVVKNKLFAILEAEALNDNDIKRIWRELKADITLAPSIRVHGEVVRLSGWRKINKQLLLRIRDLIQKRDWEKVEKLYSKYMVNCENL